MEAKRVRLVNEYSNLSIKCAEANNDFKALLARNQYINYYVKDEYIKKYLELHKEVTRSNKYLKLDLSADSVNKIVEFKDNYINANNIFNRYNINYVENEKKANKDLFDDIEGRALDDQQRECILREEKNNLVIAGAGSGKTTTIVGKVKYLLKRHNYNPQELLVLSFTNASASEMAERIKAETSENIAVMTFHKLGLNIISEVEGKKPSLIKMELYDFVAEEFNELTKDTKYNSKVSSYFLSYLKKYKSRFDFKNEGEYIEYLKDTDIRTLKGERVKSFEEMEIANFLFINGIKYEYERKYEKDTRNKNYSQYMPDFYLPDHKIYIEHFGIDRNGNVPKFFRDKDGQSAKDAYNEGIRWKREIHKRYDTILVETYSFEKLEGNLSTNLKNKLQGYGVSFNEISRNELWTLIEKHNTNELKSFVSLMSTFISQLKGNNFNLEDIKQRNKISFKAYEKNRNEAFIELITPIYNNYEKALKDSGDIDFNDMINRATSYVEQGKYNKKYSYIIVDEYQDISKARYMLIKAIKDKNDSNLFCVGDDWQSIYRFAGSQVNLFTNFEKYYGYTQKSYIETTYRFNKNIIDISSNFILKNKSQIKKQLKPFVNNDKESVKLLHGENTLDLRKGLRQKLEEMPEKSTVALLGRYNHVIDLKPYLDEEITSNYDRHTKEMTVNYKRRKDLSIKFYTVHRSKGLQADYVFILNNSNKKLGFPSLIEDDAVLKLFESETENFENAEERRLMYVALTRAKKEVYLMIDNSCKSSFIRELEEDLLYTSMEEKEQVIYCPHCRKGKLVLKKGPYSYFWGCSNFPFCRYSKKQERDSVQL